MAFSDLIIITQGIGELSRITGIVFGFADLVVEKLFGSFYVVKLLGN
jgi:hypothetical protein